MQLHKVDYLSNMCGLRRYTIQNFEFISNEKTIPYIAQGEWMKHKFVSFLTSSQKWTYEYSYMVHSYKKLHLLWWNLILKKLQRGYRQLQNTAEEIKEKAEKSWKKNISGGKIFRRYILCTLEAFDVYY